MTLFDLDGGNPLEGLDLTSATGLLALMGQQGIGAAKAISLARRFGTWPTMAAASETELTAAAGKAATELAGRPEPYLQDPSWPDGVRAVGFFDDDFPERLRTIPGPPAVLWVTGSLPAAPAVAVVGTRDPTPYGRDVARLVATEAVREGFGVVSGLALGIDTIAHEAALDAGGLTWAVLGCGVDVPSPAVNKELAERMVASGGGLLAEVPPGSSVSPQALVARDRLQSGLSAATVVAQSGIPSGTLHTARFTIEQGRVLAVARPPVNLQDEPASAGNLALTDPEGIDPAVLKATGPTARAIASRRPAADVVLNSRRDLPALWERARR